MNEQQDANPGPQGQGGMGHGAQGFPQAPSGGAAYGPLPPPYGPFFAPPHPTMVAGYYGVPGGPHPGHAGYYGVPQGPYQVPQGTPHPAACGAAPGMGMPPGHGEGPDMAGVMQELANGGNGLSSLGKFLNFDDSEFWKGALVGAAAVLLLTNESVQSALFKTGVKAKDAVDQGVAKVKAAAAAEQGSD